jgi:hypothetical protein
VRNLAAYVMRGRKHAILLALLFTFIPFVGWISDVIVALVTLRKGAKEGALVLLWVLLPSVVLAIVSYPQLWLYDIVGGSLVSYGLAVLLHYSNSWARVLQVGALVGIVSVFIVHICVPDITQHWLQTVTNYLSTAQQQFNWNIAPVNLQQIAYRLAKIATGVQVALLLLGDLFNLAIARWCQAHLFNPQALAPELRNVRISYFAVAMLILVLLGCLAGMAAAIDSLPVVVLPFILAALSLIHSCVVSMKITKWWLIGFYGLLVLFLPYLIVLLVLVALIDCWLDIRRRMQQHSSV